MVSSQLDAHPATHQPPPTPVTPRRGIDGFFTAFDVSTLPQQIDQGHFVLSSRAAAHRTVLPPPAPAPVTAVTKQDPPDSDAPNGAEPESDMV